MNNCIYLYEILEVKIPETYFQTYVPFCFESDGNNNRILIFFTLFKRKCCICLIWVEKFNKTPSYDPIIISFNIKQVYLIVKDKLAEVYLRIHKYTNIHWRCM